MLAALLLAAAGTLPTGAVVPSMGAPAGEDYALYLPTAYEPSRRWPVVYLLDARGRALVPLERFRAGAEKHGYVLASAYGSASDAPLEPTVKAVQAIWSDTHQRLSLDDRRLYLAGFSGTVRVACYLALAAPGSFRGVIGAGGGFPSDRPPTAETPFLFFGTVGDRDFNYDEMRQLDDRLLAVKVPHRLVVFAGGHQWMPAELATRALEWLEVEAMQAGHRPRNAALVQELWTRDLSEARALEAAGNLPDALVRYQGMVGEFAGLRDTAEAETRASALSRSPELEKARRTRTRAVESERRWLAEARAVLNGALPVDARPLLRQVVSDLRIAELTRMAAGAGEEALSAARVLARLAVDTGFYIPRLLSQRGSHRRAAFFLELATLIQPEDAGVRYRLAVAQGTAGMAGQALDSLEKAVALGWDDAASVEREAAFARLRREAAFQRLLEEMKAKAP